MLLERCNQGMEEKEYPWAVDGYKSLIELLDSKETVARLEACLAQVVRKLERAKE